MTRHVGRAALLALLLATPAAGATWEDGRIEVPGNTPVYALSPSGRGAAVDASGRIHLVVQGYLGDHAFQVAYATRDAAGAWEPAVLISESANARSPSVAVGPDGGVHVVWEDAAPGSAGIQYRHRAPDGAWDAVEVLTAGGSTARDPVCAVDSFGRVHVAWIHGSQTGNAVAYARRVSGTGWIEPVRLDSGGGTPETPTVVADGSGNVHLAWSDRQGSAIEPGIFNYELFYARIEPVENPAPVPSRLTDDLGVSRQPYLEATGDGTLHLVWLDTRASVDPANSEVFYRRYLPGIGWGRDKRFTYGEEVRSRPVVTAGGLNTVNVAWEDFRHGNPEIYYRQITVETGWDPLATRLTSDANPSTRPSLLALPGGGLVLLWTDAPDGATFKVYAREGNVQYTLP